MSEIVKILTHTVDLRQTLEKTDLHTLFVMGDNEAHRFELEILSGSAAANLEGATVTGYFTNFKEDTTVEVAGKVEDGKAVVVLSKPCYALHGQFVLTIQVKSGEAENTVFLGDGYMRRTKGETIIYDDYIVYDVSTLLAQISAMRTATDNANQAAAAANAAAQHAPYVDAATGTWMYWDAGAGKYVNTGTMATGPKGEAGNDGEDGLTPHIGSNGNWWIGGIDTGVKAQGPAGQNGTGSGTVTAVNGVGPDAAGNVQINAENVGARPNTWTPTAAEVGARPNTWTPTAAEVGARPNTWTPTASEVGALPATGTAADASKLGGVAASEYAKLADIATNTGGLSMDLLWQNANVESEFAGQSVLIDFSGYQYAVFFNATRTTAKNLSFPMVCKIGGSITLIVISQGKIASRAASVTVNGVEFMSTWVSSGYGVSGDVKDNTILIPYQIFGLKGVEMQ